MGYLNFIVTIIAICLVYLVFIKPHRERKINKKVDIEDAGFQENIFIRPFIKLGRSIFCPEINGRVKGIYLFRGYYLSFENTKLTWLRGRRIYLSIHRKTQIDPTVFVDNFFMAPYQGAFISVNISFRPKWKHEYLDNPEELAMMMITKEEEFFGEYTSLEPIKLENIYLFGYVLYGKVKWTRTDGQEGFALKALFPTKDVAIALRAFIPLDRKSQIALEDCLNIFKSFSWEL